LGVAAKSDLPGTLVTKQAGNIAGMQQAAQPTRFGIPNLA